MSSISPAMHPHKDVDDTAKASSVVNPTLNDESGQSTKAPSLSQTSSSGFGNLPGTFPRDPQVPLDSLNDQAGTTDSSNNVSLYDAARDDVRHAFGVAAQYLPQSVVGAFGSVLPAGTTDAHDVNKKLDSTEADASNNGNSAAAKKSLFDPKNTAVAGITSEFPPSESSDVSSKNASAGPHARADTNASDDSLKKGLTETYAPANFASDSSIDKSSIAPDAMPSPDAGRKDKIDGDGKKPAFVTYAPAPVVTDSKPSQGAGNTPSTLHHTAPSIAQALDSTAKKDSSVDRDTSSPSHTSAGRSNAGEDKATNEHPPFAKYAPAPIITDSKSSRSAADNGDVPAQKDMKQQKEGDLSGNSSFASYAPAPGITNSQPSARANDNTPRPPPEHQGFSGEKDVQKSGDGQTDADSKRKRAAEAAALGAGIGTLGGATYEHSRSPAKDSATGSQNPFDKTNRGVLSSSRGAPQGRGTPASATDSSGPATSARDGGEDKPIASATSDSESTRDPETGSSAAAGRATSTSRTADKEVEKQADLEQDMEAEKALYRREKEAAAAAASAEAARKHHQKEMEKEQQKVENQARERERGVKRHEKEVVAAAAAADKEKRDKEKANQKEQHRLGKEAHEREKEAKRHEKDIAVAPDKRRDADQSSMGKEGSRLENDSGTAAAAGPIKEEVYDKNDNIQDNASAQDKDQFPNDGKEPHEIAAAVLATAAADRERKRHSTEEPDSSNKDSATDFKKTSPNDKTIDLSSGGASARPGPNALARSGSQGYGPAKSGTDSDFPLDHADGGRATKAPAVDLDGKGRRSTDSAAPGKTSSARQPEHNRSRYHGTEGVQEKHDGGALKSSTIDKNGGKPGEESGQDDKDNGNGKGEKGFVKHMVEKMKDKLHH